MLEILEAQDMEALGNYLLVRGAIILLCWSFIFVANFVDFCSGRDAAKAIGEHIDSKGYRRTFTKIGDYYRVLIFALLFDLIGGLFTFYKLPFMTMIGSIAIIAIECKSVIENSRKKKSQAGNVPDMVKKIVQCTRTDQGQEILNQIMDELKKQNV